MGITATKADPSKVAKLISSSIDADKNLSAADKTKFKKAVAEIQHYMTGTNAAGFLDKIEKGAMKGGDWALGRLGTTLVGGGIATGAGLAAWDQILKADQGMSQLTAEFSKHLQSDNVGRAIWNAIPDAGNVGIHGVLAVAFAYVGLRAGVNWAEQVGLKATDG